MTTSEIVRDRALELAQAGMEGDRAVSELSDACGGRRVAAVRARQELVAMLDGGGDHDVTTAVRLVDDLLAQMPE